MPTVAFIDDLQIFMPQLGTCTNYMGNLYPNITDNIPSSLLLKKEGQLHTSSRPHIIPGVTTIVF